MYYLLATGVLFMLAITSQAAEWTPPTVELPKDLKHPYVACTPDELARIKAAYAGEGRKHEIVAGIIEKAKAATTRPLVFPPRGGQHNQWYQCDACQIALQTLDDTHHQCPKCQKVYTGEPYDDVIFARKHRANLRSARDAAWAFAITGQKPYAEFAARVLKGYAERYRKYPYHSNGPPGSTPGKTGGHLAEQTLDESSMMALDIAPAYDLIYDALTADERKDIEDNLIRPMLENIAKHKAGKGNWQTWHNAAFITGGAVIGDVVWVKRAIDDDGNGFLDQMKISVSKDGMWYENSWGYHFYTLQALVAITEQARRLNLDLWHNPTMKAMFTLPIRYTMPDGNLPRYGDDVNSSALKQQGLMALAANAYGDEALKQTVASITLESILLGIKPTPNSKPVIEGSEVFDGAGHAILRTRGEAGLAAAITYGPFGGFHGHFDKLSFVFYGYGKELGVDPGRAASQAYRLPILKNWYRATVSHNAVVVDGRSQEGAAGKLLGFSSNDSYALAWTHCSGAYKGIDHKRLLLLTPTYLLVVDDLLAGHDARFDWVYHNRGTAVKSSAADKAGEIAEPYTGNEFLQNVRTGRSNGPIAVDFNGDVSLRLLAAATKGAEVVTADGPGKSVEERIPMAMITQRGKSAQFIVALEPHAKDQQPKVTAVEVEEVGGTPPVIVIKHAGGIDKVGRTAKSIQIHSAGKLVLEANLPTEVSN